MPITVSCGDLGADCDFLLNGSSMDELVGQAAAHAVEAHGCTEDLVLGADWRDQMTAVMRNISRPAHLRASSPPVPPAPFGDGHGH